MPFRFVDNEIEALDLTKAEQAAELVVKHLCARDAIVLDEPTRDF